MTPCISPLWTKTGVHQKLPANGLHISLVTPISLNLVQVFISINVCNKALSLKITIVMCHYQFRLVLEIKEPKD